MANRIFVNKNSELYRQITGNGGIRGPDFGLGAPSDYQSTIGANLGKRSNEIFFYADELRDKRRKLIIGLENLTNPTFFVDGLIDPKVVKSTIEQYEVNFAATGNINIGSKYWGYAVVAGGIVRGVLAAKAASTTLLAGVIATGPVGWILAAASVAINFVFGNWIGKHAQAKAEDDAQKWTFSRSDFPTITGAVLPTSARRSIRRLYDDRRTFGGNNFNDNEAIARLTREIVTDALFSKPAAIRGILQPGHSGDGDGRFATQEQMFALRKNSSGPNATYIDSVFYLVSYISLIDAILSLNDDGLSRSPDVTEAEFTAPLRIQLDTAQVRLYNALSEVAEDVINEKFLTFFDDTKEYKTLLNFGNDAQYLAEGWRIAPQSSASIQLKLFSPIDANIRVFDRAFISQEFAKTVVDNIEFELSEQPNLTPSLRPRNTNVGQFLSDKKSVKNITLESLDLQAGSAGVSGNSLGTPISYEDTVFRRWYTDDFNSSELNIDFTDYNNFVQFGSATFRLNSFVQKLNRIETLSSEIKGSTVGDALRAQEKESIIRAFDPYEQFLYYSSGSIYSGSAFYADLGVEYNPTGSWPRVGDIPLSITSSVSVAWYATQSAIAQRFDDNNPNYLVKHLPAHIQEDANSEEFLRFVSMFGHVADNLKSYIDQFTNIYATHPDPYKDLTLDQVYEVATSFGLNLPNVYSLESLQDYIGNVYGDESISRALVSETWKRFLHIMSYLYKIKGSRESLSTILNAYGINSPSLLIKESSYASTGSFVQSEEFTYGLKFSASLNSNIRIPFVSSSIVGSTLITRFRPTTAISSSLLTGNLTGWAVNIVPHPSRSVVPVVKDHGRIEIVSGTNKVLIASSSYFPLYSEDYTVLALQSQSGKFTIIQSDGDQILHKTTGSTNIPNTLWNGTTFVYIGGSGSVKTSTHFDGIVDEIRLWGDAVSDDALVKYAYDPGQYYGNTYSSSYQSLYVSIPFSQPSSSISVSATNESPFSGTDTVQVLPTQNFTANSYEKISRNIKQFVPYVGGMVYSTNKTTVVGPPVFQNEFVDSTDNTRILKPNKSIVLLDKKYYVGGLNDVSFGVSPTDFINSNIVRSIGNIEINNLIGNPRLLKRGKYAELSKIFAYYKQYYNKFIDVNEYTRFYSNLAQGPAEIAESTVPAKAKLLTGVIIESPALSRKKLSRYKSVKIGGSGAKAINLYLSGSISVQDVGAYSAEATVDTQQNLEVDGTVSSWEGTATNTMPIPDGMYAYYEGAGVNTQPVDNVPTSPYPRKPFDSELTVSPFLPFYNIPPRSDLSDYGTITYFHKLNGLYKFSLVDQFKQLYKVVFDRPPLSTISPIYAKVSLFPSGSIGSLSDVPGRNFSTIGSTTYTANGPTYNLSTQSTDGFITIANVLSLIGVVGAAGLRLRLYDTAENRQNDSISRPFTTVPGPNSGVLFDAVLNGFSDVNPFLLIQTENSTIYYRVTNETSSNITSEIRFDYFSYQPQELIPRGYLPRHYKFTRDTGTSIRRRNYIGCLASSDDNIVDPLGNCNDAFCSEPITDTDPTSIYVARNTSPQAGPIQGQTSPIGQRRLNTDRF